MKILFLLVLLPLFSFGQNPPFDPNLGKDFHHRKALGIDELLEKSDPKGYKAMTSKSNFMVVSNYKNGKRWRYFEGDIFRFKAKDGKFYQEDIAFIDDSTFTVYRYNNDIRRMEEFTFKPADVNTVYKGKRGKNLLPVFIQTAGITITAIADWAIAKNPPYKNKDFLIITPIVAGGNYLIFNYKRLFNKQKMTANKDLRIIKPQ